MAVLGVLEHTKPIQNVTVLFSTSDERGWVQTGRYWYLRPPHSCIWV